MLYNNTYIATDLGRKYQKVLIESAGGYAAHAMLWVVFYQIEKRDDYSGLGLVRCWLRQLQRGSLSIWLDPDVVAYAAEKQAGASA